MSGVSFIREAFVEDDWLTRAQASILLASAGASQPDNLIVL